jgi:two-component system CheB/CheR fusion protein
MAERKQARKRAASKQPSKAAAPRKSSARATRASSEPAPDAASTPFVIGLGASAGGLEALTEFFDHMPSNSGAVFVVVTHRSPEHANLQPPLLQQHTVMPIVEVADTMAIEPNIVYLAPPMKKLAIISQTFQVMESDDNTSVRLPIDYFFRALADDQGDRAVAIVLSGTGTDGTLGVQAVKAKDGLTMVQALDSARYTGMPESALSTGQIDLALAPRDMPEALLAYMSVPQPRIQAHSAFTPLAEVLPKIFVLLRGRTNHDFSSYKATTIRRRIERRMKVHQLDTPSQYLRYLQESPHELDLLFKELLISVTQFFRDAEAFDLLTQQLLPRMLAERPPHGAIRVWVPGCATGEEAYSLAIAIREAMQRNNTQCPVQIFATDLDAQAIATARLGQYPEGIAADVSPERLERFFVKEDNHYRVRKEIRETVVFAIQNLIKDPPFTKLDLLSCRNLLIYLDSTLQRQLLPLFHYALNPGGLLFLGSSETVSGFTDLFDAEDRKWKIFRRKETTSSSNPMMSFTTAGLPQFTEVGGSPNSTEGRHSVTLAAQLERFLVTAYVPASIIVTERGDVVYVHGRTGQYLEPAPGLNNQNVLDMAREGLRHELALALQQAATNDQTIIRDDLSIKDNGGFVNVKIMVRRIPDPEAIRGLFLVTFEPNAAATSERSSRPKTATTRGQRPSRVAELEEELAYTQAHLQNTVEELETTNEELRATNEEVQSTNEELQSSNEELETSREEMQSLNEELQTVNSELQDKVEELSQANNDMQNLLNSTNVATIFLDDNLRIKRFTRQMTRVIKLIDSDVGRPLSDLAYNLNYDRLITDATEVLQTLVYKEVEVHTHEGVWYLMRLMPYRTTENVIDGLVITFVEITKLKETEQLVRELRIAEHIVQTTRTPLLVLDEALQVVSANQAFCATFHLSIGEIKGQEVYHLGDGEWDIPELHRLFETLLVETNECHDYEVSHTFARLGPKVLIFNAHRFDNDENLIGHFFLSIEDATETQRDASA